MKTASLAALLALTGCATGGRVVFTTYGEKFIEEKIPADGEEANGFVDGWELKYDKFLVALSDITLARTSGGPTAQMSGAIVFDLTRQGPVEVAHFENLTTERWDAVSFAIAPPPAAAAGDVLADDVRLMRERAYGVYLEATATKGAVRKRLTLGVPLAAVYEECGHEQLGPGVVVPERGAETVQLTLHGDHLWYDDLESLDAQLRFQAFADADRSPMDGLITEEELAAAPLPAGRYGTGAAPEVKTLRDFLLAQARTLAHYRGEGECHAKAR